MDMKKEISRENQDFIDTEIKAVAYTELRVGSYNFEYIKDLKITMEANQHGSFSLTGVLKDEEKDSAVHTTESGTPIEIYYLKNNSKIVIFTGVVTKVEIEVIEGVYNLILEGKTFSYLMDIHKKSRSFQNLSSSIKAIISTVMQGYGNADFMMEIGDRKIGELLLQHQETDWQFIKRIVSKDNAALFPVAEFGKIAYFVGIPEISINLEEDIKNYTIYKEIDRYKYMKENYIKNLSEVDYTIYKINTYQILRLGNNVSFKGHKFYVKALEYILKDGILQNYYHLQLKNGLKQKPLFNEGIVGMSLSGNIIDIKRDTVKVHLKIDEKQDTGNAYFFPYSTMSASSDGSGWYCMPELGDSVRVYFPTKEENEAFAISSVSSYMPEEGAPIEGDRMGDPNVKYLRTATDKEISFNPSGIGINCNSGQGQVNLNNDGTVSITGKSSVYINASENVNIRAEKSLIMTANESIDIACDKGGQIVFTDGGDIEIKGMEVKSN